MSIVKKLLRRALRVAGIDKLYSDEHLGYVVNTLNQQVQGFRNSAHHGRIIDSSLLKTKSSDTAFILGSGPSIGALSQSHFNEIATCDSFGFNSWPAHGFVPSHYVLQLSREGSRRKSQIELLRSRRRDYAATEVLVRGDHTFVGWPTFNDVAEGMFPEKNFWFLPELAIHSKVEIDPVQMMHFFELLGLLQHGVIGKAVPKWRSTVGLLISLTYQMGYKNIVLCGIDVKDSIHFFDDPAYKNKVNGLDLTNINRITMFESGAHSRNKLSKYLTDFAGFAAHQSSAQLFLASPFSVLKGKLPDWQFRSPWQFDHFGASSDATPPS